MGGLPEPPAVPPPPEVLEALGGGGGLPCDASRALDALEEAASRLGRVQGRMAALLAVGLAAAVAVPAAWGAAGFLVVLLALAVSLAAAVRVFQALVWTLYLRRLYAAIRADPAVLEEACGGG